MEFVEFIWDLPNDPRGNIQHIAEHGVTAEEAEEVVREGYVAAEASRSSGLPTAVGWTSTGKRLAVIFEVADPSQPTVYVLTAYETTPLAPRKRRRKKR